MGSCTPQTGQEASQETNSSIRTGFFYNQLGIVKMPRPGAMTVAATEVTRLPPNESSEHYLPVLPLYPRRATAMSAALAITIGAGFCSEPFLFATRAPIHDCRSLDYIPHFVSALGNALPFCGRRR
jgi:hypothetical protein